VSPLAVRRYRAERLLRAEFRRLQARVTRTVARRLAAGGAALDGQDIEACYAAAWQGLYEAVLQGQQIVNPAGWLVLVTYRRAVDEQRARARAERRCEAVGAGATARAAMAGVAACTSGGDDDGFAGALDDRDLVRQLFEGLRSRLSPQEREAAVLCYLHGLNRTQAAASMGISERRINRLMDGRGPGCPGASAKLGALVASIREGRWCEQQASLMRGLAFGILDRSGERYRLALAHSSECPACRAYVASLRGLAAALPPALLPGGLAGAILTRAGAGAGAAAAGAGAGGQLGGAGVLSGAGAAGAGGAGSGWVLLGGPVSAKLAAGCLLAIGIGAGCVGLGVHGPHQPHRRGAGRHDASTHARRHPGSRPALAGAASRGEGLPAAPAAGAAGSQGASGEAARAPREFGPEQAAPSPAEGGSGARASSSHTHARVASSGGGGAPGGPPRAASSPARAAPPAGPAEREFGPG
jgi:DNA-directed RNA polymerase specialized sigma24 family protein